MLIGQYHSKLTEKERVAIPVKFREVLVGDIFICRWYEQSLAIFDEQAWRKVLDLAVGESILTTPTRDTERFLLGGAFEIDLDKQGRFVLPKALKDYAQIKNELVFLGLRDRIEIWDRENWEVKEKNIVRNAESLIKQVQETKLQGLKGGRN